MVQQGFKAIINFLTELDIDQPSEIDIETDIGSKLDTISLGTSIDTAEYTKIKNEVCSSLSTVFHLFLGNYRFTDMFTTLDNKKTTGAFKFSTTKKILLKF